MPDIRPYPLPVPTRVLLGVDDGGQHHYWGPGSHTPKTLLILGPAQSGRTNVLRLCARHYFSHYLYYGVETAVDMQTVLDGPRDVSATLTAATVDGDMGSRLRATLERLEDIADSVAAGKQFARQVLPEFPSSMTGGGHTSERVVLIDRVDLLFSPKVPMTTQRRAAAVIATLVDLSTVAGLRLVMTGEDGFFDEVAVHHRATGLPELFTTVNVLRTQPAEGNRPWQVALDGTEPYTAFADPETRVNVPTSARYPSTGADHPWNRLRLGVGSNGQEMAWDPMEFPHLLAVGRPGVGKTMLARVLVAEALSSGWGVFIADPKRVEWAALNGVDDVLGLETELKEIVTMVSLLTTTMQARYEDLADRRTRHFTGLPSEARPVPLMLVVEELWALLSPVTPSAAEGRYRDALRQTLASDLAAIARLGGAAGVHLVLLTQRPDAPMLANEVFSNVDCRIAVGRMDATQSQTVVGTDDAANVDVLGRAVMRQGDDVGEFQMYLLADDDYARLLDR